MIVRALKRNTFTADQPVRVVVNGCHVLLHGTVSHPDLIPEIVATVESVAPYIMVHSRLRVRRTWNVIA
jgi:hypothetical protein